jgi:protease IV
MIAANRAIGLIQAKPNMNENARPSWKDRGRRLLNRILVVLGTMTLFSMISMVVLLLIGGIWGERMPAQAILELDLEKGVIESVPEDAFGAFLRRNDLTLRTVVEALKRAETDDRVKGVVAKVGSGALGLAQVEEVRAAITSFRATGKPALIFAETFGEFAPGRTDYYLATAFDEIHLQPSGDVGLAGLISEQPFLAGTFELAGVEPQMDGRHEFKDALNLFTEEEMTEPQREATLRVLTSIYDNLVGGIASGRGLAADEVRRLIDNGPYFGQEAVRAGLVDRLSYRDEVYDSLQARVGGEFLYAQNYLSMVGGPHERGPTVALIYGTGTIQRGESQVDPMVGGAVMGSETVTRAFREAIESDDVEAILFRVDSPGGSYVASDAIWRETLRARNAGKPVVVSMGNVAGSGGYFVAAGADRIVAQPSTITGSIGVFGGKMLIDELSEKVGVTWDDVRVGGNATMWSNVREFSPAEWERLQYGLDRIYDDFTAKVASGRGLSRDSTHAIARGRIWTGADAVELGLIDRLGGYDVALDLVKELAGVAPDQSVRIRVYPRERSIVEMLLAPRPSSSQPTALEAIATAGALVRMVATSARELGIFLNPPGVLTVPHAPAVR